MDDPELRRVLWFVLGGARGGENRARIIHELSVRPMNLNQIAERLGVDYRTVMYHVVVLRRNSLLSSRDDAYGAMVFLSPRLEAGLSIFKDVCASLRIRFE
ncbi:MAG: winged helix-turn-helix transcriptional regulator [Thaumarchaeota archaeon]|nr:winged helix-turn-helix transcriptional regulator [Nitrososphaerota archaeon]